MLQLAALRWRLSRTTSLFKSELYDEPSRLMTYRFPDVGPRQQKMSLRRPTAPKAKIKRALYSERWRVRVLGAIGVGSRVERMPHGSADNDPVGYDLHDGQERQSQAAAP